MERFNLLLPLWLVITASIGYWWNEPISQYQWALVPTVAFIMFTMGLTLTFKDFLEPFHHPFPLVLGICLQFIIMPMLAWVISLLIKLPAELFAGMILVGTAPGGVASNLLTYLAGGKVALSVGMTAFSTLASIIVTPLLTGYYLDQVVDVPQIDIIISITNMIFLPIIAGIAIRACFPTTVRTITPLLPSFAVLAIAFVICLVVALNTGSTSSLNVVIVLAVLLHNIIGLSCGYFCARLARLDKKTARTIAIEVGTQNSGMAMALAIKHFSAVSAIPGALFSVIQNFLGAVLASYWSQRSKSSLKE